MRESSDGDCGDWNDGADDERIAFGERQQQRPLRSEMQHDGDDEAQSGSCRSRGRARMRLDASCCHPVCSCH